MSGTVSPIEKYLSLFDAEKDEILADFFRFLQFPSISSEPEHARSVQDCAAWLVSILENNGLAARHWNLPGQHPVILAEWLGAGPAQPTVLLYGHYDVQPVDPLKLWHSPPFEPTVRDGQVFARGAQDNKGQSWYTVSAVCSLLNKNGSLPVNLKLCLEGEEEMGSSALRSILTQEPECFAADYVFVIDVGLKDALTPSVTVGVRGLASLTAEFIGSGVDLHSGTHGGIAYNPNHALVEILAKMRDASGKVTVPGFYDLVIEPPAEDLALLNFDFDKAGYEKTFAARPLGGERAFSPVERNVLRPTLEINGIAGGYAGSGFKTVIPASATAKISARLVLNQDPHHIVNLLGDFIRSNTPEGVMVEITEHTGSRPLRTDLKSKAVQTAASVFAEAFGKPSSFLLDGATIPIVVDLAEATRGQVVLIGYGLPDDNIHAPNEHFGIDRLRLGFATICRLLEVLGS